MDCEADSDYVKSQAALGNQLAYLFAFGTLMI